MSNSFGNTLYKMMNELDTPPNPQDIPCSSLNYSIRRTMSADMSSPKWLQQNGFFSSSMKRAQSSEQLQALGEEDSQKQSSDEEKKGSAAFEDIWSSIQSEKQSWSSILSQQNNDGSGSGSGPVPPPYVHPLVRRSTSSLSEKSLEICTESLGSETGSDVFSYPPSDPEDSDKEVEVETEDKPEHNNKVVEEEDEVEEVINECDHEIIEEVPKYKNKYYSSNQGIKTSFPPPLPSLAHRGGGGDGSNLHIMRSHRHDGRLVLEAVSVPSHNCLRAHRRGGRLLLTLANQQEQESEEEVIITQEEEKEKEEVTPNGLKNHVHQSSPPTMMIMSKIIGLTSTRNNSTWRRNINATIIRSLDDHHHHEEEEAEKHVSKAASWANSKSSLPPRPKVARRSTTSGPNPKSTATTVTALNTYEYYWRQTTAVAVFKPLAGGDIQQVEKENNNNNNNNINKLVLEYNGKGVSVAKQGVVVVKAGVVATGEKEAEYLVPFLRGCKEPRRRSLLFWEPYCIATS